MGPSSSAADRRRWGLVALAVLAAVASVLAADLARPLPAAWFAPVESRTVRDRHGRLLAERAVPDRGRAEWVELDAVAPALIDALVAAEDHRFGRHPGVDPLATARAAWADLRAGAAVQGGSTLHQQTARLLSPRGPGLPGKVGEAWRAVKLWAHLSDREVLTWYLNRAWFGQGCTGVAAAARRTFDETPATLSVSEAATLVGLLPAPARLHPEVDPVAARAARDRVLDRMVRRGVLRPEAAERARAEPMELRRPPVAEEAAHVVERALSAAPRAAEIRTTLDLDLQREVAALAAAQVQALADLDVSQAAVLVVHLPTREIRAWVGAADPEARDGLVDGVTARRSPGSALKPLLYAVAFDEGVRPGDVLFDVESRYDTTHGSWLPENYDRTYLGPVTVRRSLGSSLNVPAVKLLREVGVSSFQARLDAAGFRARRSATSLGLGLSLGDLEVSLLELVRASAALAGDGRLRPLRLTVDGPDHAEGVPVVSAASAALVTDILADPSARTAGFGRWGPLERPYPAAAKTGTSTAFRDNWTVGWTDEWVVGVWVGNFDGRPMRGTSGVTGAAPLWAAVLDRVTGGEAGPLPTPPGHERREACALSGLAPGPGCPRAADWAPAGAPDRPACDWHPPGCSGVAWPPALAGWAADAGRPSCPRPGSAAEFGIAWPADGATIYVDPRLPDADQELPLRASGPPGGRVQWRVDGADLGPSEVGARRAWRATPGEHRVEILVDGVVVGARTVTVRGGR